MNKFRLRSADAGDARFIVPLIAESSGGVWPLVWKAGLTDGDTIDDFAVRYLLDESNPLSIKNTTIVETQGRRTGAMICYRENTNSVDDSESPTTTASVTKGLQEVLRPYRELSDSNSWFIAELCLLPETRGQGIGTHLLEHAEKTTRAQGLPRLTLRVFSENTGAVRLYKRYGFSITGQRPVISHPDITVSGDVYLMSMPVNP